MTTNADVPHNPITGTIYQGMNATALAAASDCKEWATFIQWKAAGYSVKKGEHGQKIHAFPEVERRDENGGVHKGRAPRSYTVFNREQVAQ